MKTSRKVRVSKSGDNLSFSVQVTLLGKLLEHSSQETFIGEKDTHLREKIETAVKDEIERDCKRFVQRMQREFKVDCIDVTKYALAKWRKDLNDKVKGDFIKKVKINIKVDVKIKSVGELV